jgi:DNA-binding transcriptional LysR family regulator
MSFLTIRERDLCLIWRHDSRLPAAVRAFLEVLHAQAPREQVRET